MKTFYFHYNKPQSKKTGKVQISLHFNKKCHIVDNVNCHVITKGKIKKSQPYFVITGKYIAINIDENNIANII